MVKKNGSAGKAIGIILLVISLISIAGVSIPLLISYSNIIPGATYTEGFVIPFFSLIISLAILYGCYELFKTSKRGRTIVLSSGIMKIILDIIMFTIPMTMILIQQIILSEIVIMVIIVIYLLAKRDIG